MGRNVVLLVSFLHLTQIFAAPSPNRDKLAIVAEELTLPEQLDVYGDMMVDRLKDWGQWTKYFSGNAWVNFIESMSDGALIYSPAKLYYNTSTTPLPNIFDGLSEANHARPYFQLPTFQDIQTTQNKGNLYINSTEEYASDLTPDGHYGEVYIETTRNLTLHAKPGSDRIVFVMDSLVMKLHTHLKFTKPAIIKIRGSLWAESGYIHSENGVPPQDIIFYVGENVDLGDHYRFHANLYIENGNLTFAITPNITGTLIAPRITFTHGGTLSVQQSAFGSSHPYPCGDEVPPTNVTGPPPLCSGDTDSPIWIYDGDVTMNGTIRIQIGHQLEVLGCVYPMNGSIVVELSPEQEAEIIRQGLINQTLLKYECWIGDEAIGISPITVEGGNDCVNVKEQSVGGGRVSVLLGSKKECEEGGDGDDDATVLAIVIPIVVIVVLVIVATVIGIAAFLYVRSRMHTQNSIELDPVEG